MWAPLFCRLERCQRDQGAHDSAVTDCLLVLTLLLNKLLTQPHLTLVYTFTYSVNYSHIFNFCFLKTMSMKVRKSKCYACRRHEGVCRIWGSTPFILNLGNKWYGSSAKCLGNFNQGREWTSSDRWTGGGVPPPPQKKICLDALEKMKSECIAIRTTFALLCIR
jgi:hypothetical protein